MKKCIFLLFLFLLTLTGFSQEEEIDYWDHWFILSNKVQFDGGEKWRHSHDFQWRANDNVKSLERIFYEGAFIYSPNSKWDLFPDLRISSKPTEIELRPGFGVSRKTYWGGDSLRKGHSLVQQLKYQSDITANEVQHGIRYILFYNYFLSEKVLIGALGGGFYRWSAEFSGAQFYRVGGSISFLFNDYNTLSIIEAIGFENQGAYWTYAHFPMVQLTIRIRKNYKYRETMIFSF
tara:strand:+ start:3173 stop:3874 length:702 start_codon:yes stop_codon:yes gene_type:complete